MANPARLLHDLFAGWLQTRQNGYGEAQTRKINDLDVFTRQHSQAMAWIAEIEAYLNGLEDQGRGAPHYKRHITAWRTWVLNYPYPWNTSNYGSTTDDITQDKLDILLGLVDRMDEHVAPISLPQVESLRDTVNEVRALLVDSTDLPADLQRHLHLLVTEASRCLDEYETTSDFALKDALDRLAMACAYAGMATHDDGNRSRWKTFLDKLAWPVATSLAIDASKVAFKALTGG